MIWISWVGAFLLSICAIPLCWEAMKTGKTDINTPFLALWFGGEICMFIYVLSLGDGPLLLNYGVNTALLLPVVATKFRREYE